MTDSTEKWAIQRLADTARSFARFTPRKNVSGAYARALADLVDVARLFAQRSDEEWAREICEVRAALRAFVDGYPDDRWRGLVHEQGCPGVGLREAERDPERPCRCDGDHKEELIANAIAEDPALWSGPNGSRGGSS